MGDSVEQRQKQPHLRIKICGVTQEKDQAIACEAGADAIGYNFYPGSPRYIQPGQVAGLVRRLPPLIASVGVFVDQPLRHSCAVAYQLGLRAIQSHGDKIDLSDSFPFSHIAAFRIRDEKSLEQIREYLSLCPIQHRPAALLLDAHVPGSHGGTGQLAPWDILADFRTELPIILAGGLTPENVSKAIARVRPWGIDVASGVENAPGQKDPGRLRAFIRNARQAWAELES